MRSSTSSSERTATNRWTMPLLSCVVLAGLLFLLVEVMVRALGYAPGVRDDSRLWALQRLRADHEEQPLVLAGDSRMLLDVDLDRLAALSGRPVVQLAIVGSTPLPVLEDLAADENFRGTVLVSVLDRNLGTDADDERAREWIGYWHHNVEHGISARIDSRLSLYLQGVSAWYASEPPWEDMFAAMILARSEDAFIETGADRSRRADYYVTRDFATSAYVQRVMLNLLHPIDPDSAPTLPAFTSRVKELLAQEHPVVLPGFAATVERFRVVTQRLAARGCRVVYVRMPSAGLMRDIENTRYPRHMYWDRFAAALGRDTLHFEDDPSLAAFGLPDGSHLDRRDIGRFTEDLYTALRSRQLLP